MKPAPFQSLTPAFDHWTTFLFRPFSMKRWFWLAIIVLGANLIGGGGGGNFLANWSESCDSNQSSYSVPATPGGQEHQAAGAEGFNASWYSGMFSWAEFDNSDWEDAGNGLRIQWEELVDGHWNMLGTWLIVFALCMIVLALMFVYFGSQFRFILLQDIIRNKDDIVQPFKDNHRQGLSYFFWELCWTAFMLAVVVLPIVMVAIQFIGGHKVAGVISLVAAIFWILFWAITCGMISVLTYDFVLPIMHIRKTGILSAWKTFMGLALRNFLQLLGYLCVKLGLFIVFGIATLIVGLLFLIPFAILVLLVCIPVGVLIYMTGWTLSWLFLLFPLFFIIGCAYLLLAGFIAVPWAVFSRCYSLSFFEGFGDEWRTITASPSISSEPEGIDGAMDPEPTPAG